MTDLPYSFPGGAPPSSNTRTVARNFIWTGLELLLTVAGSLITTIAVARTFGPTQLGYFNLVYWLTNIAGQLASLGIPAMTFKYMGEHYGAGDRGTADAIFRFSLRLQGGLAFSVVLLGMGAVLGFGDPNFRACSLLLVLSVIPQMLTFIPSQGNAAAEQMASNTKGAFAGMVVNVAGIALSLVMHWGLAGIAAVVLLYRSVEFVAKMIPVLRRMDRERRLTLPRALRRRMFSFSGRSTGLMLLQIIVWDRSDIILLRLLNPDIRQIAFFSVAFSISDRLMRIPMAFGAALAPTQMKESGRDRKRLVRMTGEAAQYVLIVALPLLFGAATMSAPLIRLLYGSQYLAAIPVFALVAVFSLPKALLAPANTLLYSAEDLGYMLRWGCIAAAINIALDIALIPGRGAIGAALGNGVAQTIAAAAIWSRAVHRFHVPVDRKAVGKVAACTFACCSVAGLAVWAHLPVVAALTLGPLVAIVVYLIGMRVLRVLSRHDRLRFESLARSIPRPLQSMIGKCIALLFPPQPLPAAAQAGSLQR